MTFTISITPGQPIQRQPIPPGLDGRVWDDFCDAYDAIVVHPYRRAMLLIVMSFMALLVFLMGTMTMTNDSSMFLPTGTPFLVGPCVFISIAGAAAVYMFSVYPRVSHDLEDLCQETTKRSSSVSSSSSSSSSSQRRQQHPTDSHGTATTAAVDFHYCHNDARHDLSEHVIQVIPTTVQQKQQDIETAIPAVPTEEWDRPLLQLRSSLWGHK